MRGFKRDSVFHVGSGVGSQIAGSHCPAFLRLATVPGPVPAGGAVLQCISSTEICEMGGFYLPWVQRRVRGELGAARAWGSWQLWGWVLHASTRVPPCWHWGIPTCSRLTPLACSSPRTPAELPPNQPRSSTAQERWAGKPIRS